VCQLSLRLLHICALRQQLSVGALQQLAGLRDGQADVCAAVDPRLQERQVRSSVSLFDVERGMMVVWKI